MFLFLTSSFNLCRSDRMQGVISFALYLLTLPFCSHMWKFHGMLKRYVLFCSDEIFCKYLLSSFGLWYQLSPAFLCSVFVWMTRLLARVGYWSHHYHCVRAHVLFKLYQCLFYKFGFSMCLCIDMKNCSFLLVDFFPLMSMCVHFYFFLLVLM